MNSLFSFLIIIPAFNEEAFISDCLNSLLKQSLLPHKIIVVDDSSTDNTPLIAKRFAEKHRFISYVQNCSLTQHKPGAKIINAFDYGLTFVDITDYDIVCKFDADLIFPADYLEKLNDNFITNSKLGLCGGVCTIFENDSWHIENLTNLDHVRGALKAYRVEAFQDIGGLQAQMGWDTADEFKLRFRNWEVEVIESLQVKHLKPTSSSYNNSFFSKQGKVFYALRYGLILTFLAGLKISLTRRKWNKSVDVMRAYLMSKKNKVKFLLSAEEGKYLRNYRWKQIRRKLIP